MTTDDTINGISKEERERLGRLYPVEVVPYNPDWPMLYEEEVRFLRSCLGEDIVPRLEHYGSTAVFGLAAKPVIDILAEITSFDTAKQIVKPVLLDLNYGHSEYKDHLVFFKGYPDLEVKYHIHMAPSGHSLWDGLLFRDYLRSHPQAAKEYENLKYRLAETHRYDREAYTEAKTEFVMRIVGLAKEDIG